MKRVVLKSLVIFVAVFAATMSMRLYAQEAYYGPCSSCVTCPTSDCMQLSNGRSAKCIGFLLYRYCTGTDCDIPCDAYADTGCAEAHCYTDNACGANGGIRDAECDIQCGVEGACGACA